ncbi:ATP-dependent RNA helicase DDX51 [Stigmatopora nigra]
MSLFSVNRYLGDEYDGIMSKDSKSLLLLAKLHLKAKRKQRQGLTGPRIKCPRRYGIHLVEKKRKADDDSTHESQNTMKKKSKAVILNVWNNMQEPVEDEDNMKKKRGDDMQINEQSETVTGRDAEVERAVEDIPNETLNCSSDFTVLGGFESKPVKKIHRVLPHWLAQPDIISRDMKCKMVPGSQIEGLNVSLLKKLNSDRIQNFFPVQTEVIPAILKSGLQHGLLIGQAGYRPRDVCVSAPTGSGKTLAFVIPIIQVLMKRNVCEIRALALLPTKELAQQVCKVFTSYAEGTTLRVVMVAGQKSFAAEQAALSEQRGGTRQSLADIVVATPGRLVDHINKNPGFCLDHLRFLIIDEADKMIDSMCQSWLNQVEKAVYGSAENKSIIREKTPLCATAACLSRPQMPLQKLLFSATLTQNPEKLQQLGLHQPRLFSSVNNLSGHCPQPSIDNQKPEQFDFPPSLSEFYVPSALSKKPLIILHFILSMKLSPILCFVNSRDTAHRLCLLVKLFGGVQVAEFSSRLSPGGRKKKLKEFEQGKINLLISTDAAARGIDISGVKCVVNYDAPQYIRTYIHRIGRTARAGKPGLAFTILLGVQEKNFLQMVTKAGSLGIQKQVIKPAKLRCMEGRYEQTLQELATVIKEEKANMK